MSWGSAKSTKKVLPLSVLDRPGVFETMRVYAGCVAGADEHIRRLRASAQTAGIRILSEKNLTQKLFEAVKKSGLSDAVVRLSIHVSGASRAGRSRVSPAPASAWIGCSVRPFFGCPQSWYRSGVRIVTGSVRRPGPSAFAAQVKGNDYMNAVGAILNASADRSRSRDLGDRPPASDPLMLLASGTVAETTVANILILKDGAVWTPPAACGILLGVTRGMVLESAEAAGLRVLEKPFTRHDLYNAEEVFLTNAAVEVLPVVEADARRIGSGRPGPWARRLRDAYRKWALPDFY